MSKIDETAKAEWAQTLTGLNDGGNWLVEGPTDKAYQQRILDLERRRNHYLTTGEWLKGVVQQAEWVSVKGSASYDRSEAAVPTQGECRSAADN